MTSTHRGEDAGGGRLFPPCRLGAHAPDDNHC